ncbi:hypothetical protein Tco_0024176, partial [Tanacetum coccineum]
MGGIDQEEVNVFKGDAEKDSSRTSGGLKEVFTTASPQVPPVSSNVSTDYCHAIGEISPLLKFLPLPEIQHRIQEDQELQESFGKSIQDYSAYGSSTEKKVKVSRGPGILLEKFKAKRLKTSDVSAQEQQESDNQDEIINLQQWSSDKLRDDLVTLWKLVKDRFKTKLPKSDLERCLFWPLKVMFKPVATDLLWQFKAPIKSWKNACPESDSQVFVCCGCCYRINVAVIDLKEGSLNKIFAVKKGVPWPEFAVMNGVSRVISAVI